MTTHELQECSGPQVAFGPFRLFLEQRILLRDETPVRLGSRAREILLVLVERAGEVVGKSEMSARVWPTTVVEEGALRVHISAIRKALGDGQDGMRYVENVTGQGYRFIATVTRVEETERPGQIIPLPARMTRIAGRDEAVAAALARAVEQQFYGEVIFMDLESVEDAEEAVRGLLAASRAKRILLVVDIASTPST